MPVVRSLWVRAPVSQSDGCGQDQADDAEGESAEDTDSLELECGDQNEADDTESAPTGTPAISAEAAQKTAETYLNAGTAVKVELEDEGGKLVYSVEFANNTDVEVDAMTGEVLGAEPAED